MNQEEQEGGGEDGVELDEHQVWGQEPQVLPLVYCSHPKLCCDHWLLLSPVARAPVCCCCTAAAVAAAAGAAAVVAAAADALAVCRLEVRCPPQTIRFCVVPAAAAAGMRQRWPCCAAAFPLLLLRACCC